MPSPDLKMMERVAADLGKLKPGEAADLDKQAIEERARQRRLERAAYFARKMNSAFKGIQGRPTRRERYIDVIERFDLMPEDS